MMKNAFPLFSIFLIGVCELLGSSPTLLNSYGAHGNAYGIYSNATIANVVPSGGNRLLIVTLDAWVGATAGVTFDGVPLIRLSTGDWAGGGKLETWYLVNPSTTSGNVIVTFEGTVSEYSAQAFTLSGVDQTTPLGTPMGLYGGSASVILSPASSTSDLVLFNVVTEGNSVPLGNGLTFVRQEINDPNGESNSLFSATGSAGSTIATIDQPANIAGVGFAVHAAAGGPSITSATTAAGQVGIAFNYQITASNSPTSFSASGLPGGLSINPTTGLISGTPTTAAVSSVTINATNAAGTGALTMTLTVNAANTAPTITTVANQTTITAVAVGPLVFTVGDAQTAATSLTVLRASSNTTLVPVADVVLFGSGTSRTVTVTPAAGQTGTAMVTLTVSDGALSTSTTFTVTVTTGTANPTPVVSSPADGTYGTAYTATASGGNGTGAIVWSLGTGSTASGAAINSSTGVISANSTGTVVIKAYRAGDATYASSVTTADFTVTIASRPITVTLSGSKNYDGTTMPTGATANITSGSLVGADTISYAFSNTLSANAGTYSTVATTIGYRSSSHAGSSSGTLDLLKPTGTSLNDVLIVCISVDIWPPTFTPPSGWFSLGTAGNTYDGQISACFMHVVDGTEGSTFSFGYGWNDATGVILCYTGVNAGTPLNVPLAYATNNAAITSGGTISAPSVTTTIDGCLVVWLGGLDSGGEASAGVFTAPAGYTLRETSNYGWSGEAAADKIKSSAGATGIASGSVVFPDAAGTFGFTIALAPVASTSLVTATVSNPANYNITYEGSYSIIPQSNPVITSPSSSGGQVGIAFNYQITASNSPTSFSASGLPGGLSINPTTGLISGTPTTAAVSSVTINATNAAGTGTLTMTLTVNASNTAPTITTVANQTTITAVAVGPLVFTVGDAQTAAASLTVVRASSNTTLVPVANVVLSGGGTSRTVTVTPAAGQTGIATITLTVSDGALSTSTTFTVAVTSGATNPTPVVTSLATGTYGAAYTATASGGNGTGAIVWSLGTGSTASGAAINSSTGVITANSAGTVVIEAYRAGDATYAPSATTADFTVTITPRPITVTLSGSKNYDGTTMPTGATASITSGSLVGSDTIGYSFGNTPSSTVGSYSALSGAIAFRGSSHVGSSSGTLVLSKPAGTAINDVLLVCISVDLWDPVFTLPAGWTLLDNVISRYDGQVSVCFIHVVDGTEGPTFSFGYGGNDAAGILLCYSGVNPVTPLNRPIASAVNNTAVSSGGAVDAPDVTTTVNGCMLVWLAGLDSGGEASAAVFTAPAGYSLRETSDFGWSDEAAADKVQSTAGATGIASGTVVFPDTAGTFGFTVALAPSAGTSLVTATVSNPSNYIITYAGSYTIATVLPTPVVTSPFVASGQIGAAFSYQITASGTPTSFGATGLPAGLTINAITGLISGVATTAGTSSVTINASNASGTGSAVLSLTITSASTTITSPVMGSGQTGAAFSYQITASNSPSGFNATGLPAGLTINTATGLISGTPSKPGTYTVTISATNAAGTVPTTITLTILAALPYTADFETAEGYAAASLDGQLGWSVSQGAALVTMLDHSLGAESVQLSAGVSPAIVSQTFAASAGQTIEFVDLFAKPVAETSLAAATTFTVEGAKFAFQRSGTQGTLYAYNGDGVGGGTWQATAFTLSLGSGNQAQSWVRLTVRLDFTRQKWDLYANAAMVASDISFSASSTYLGLFKMQGNTATTSGLDDIYAGPSNPLFADINTNGIDDTWETSHGLPLATDNRNTSPTGNGVTVVQAYVAGTDPTDFFNGSVPTLMILGGNSQVTPAGQFNSQPFDLGVWNAAGTAPLVNAPVTFTVQGGSVLLASTNAANPQLHNSLTIYSDSDGTVQAYFRQPGIAGVHSQISVSAGLRQITLLTQSASIGGPDNDFNGLADAWEQQYFGHAGVDPSADPDGDGLSNIVEYQLGTNPLSTVSNTTNPTATVLKVHRPSGT